MSQFSKEIKHVLDKSQVVEMTQTLNDIIKMEPYSLDNKKLMDSKHKLSTLVGVYDFLKEYVTGNEETDNQLLWDILRLAGTMSTVVSPKDYRPILNTYPTTNTYTILVDENPTWTGYIAYGYHDIKVQYNGVADSMRLIHHQKMIGADGNEIEFQNVFIDLPGDFEVRVYDEDGVLITTLLIPYLIKDVPDWACPDINILDTCGLPVTLVLP